MVNEHTRARNQALNLFATCALVVTVLCLLSATAMAQSSATSGHTPLGMAPGAPAGSYALSGFETVNPYNGGLNFTLPLLQVGGRGGASHTINLKIEYKWRVRKISSPGGTYSVTQTQWEGVQVLYGPGTMNGRVAGTPELDTCPAELPALTRLTFTASDGTEYEFRDALYEGQEFLNSFTDNGPGDCLLNGSPRSRGKVWVTRDGSAMTFISDQPIYDFYGAADNPNRNVGLDQVPGIYGYLFMKDGTRYRIEDNKVEWIQDRNGNRIDFTYEGLLLKEITDSLGRVVTIRYVSTPQEYYEIEYSGFGGADRFIRIYYRQMNHLLRKTHVGEGPPNPPWLEDSNDPWTKQMLFPEINNADSDNVYKPVRVEKVVLPDDRTYKFFYNVYGELARVELPTRGAIEYDWYGGLSNGNASGVMGGGSGPEVYRRVVERRVYSDTSGVGAGTLEGKTTFSRPEFVSGTPVDHVEVDHRKPGGQLLSRERHYYHGSAKGSFFESPTKYPAWNDGKEHKTEILDANGTTVLQRSRSFYDQSPPAPWWGSSVSPVPPYDTFLEEATSEWPQTGQVSKQEFVYDQYNNRIEVKEYDFGSGAAGSLVRKTVTSYLTYPTSNAGYNYDTVNGSNGSPNTTNPDPTKTYHLRGLPLQTSVYDGQGFERSRATFEYDNYASPNTLEPRTNASGHNSTDYTADFVPRGNVTKVTNPVLLTSQQPATKLRYDILGNVVKSTDPRDKATSFTFDDNFGSPDIQARPPQFIPSQPTFAFATKVTNPKGHEAYTQFDYSTGKPVNGEDANGVVSKGSYADLLDRATELVVAVSHSALTRRTRFSYDDTNRVVTTTSDQFNLNDDRFKTETLYDGLGRTTQSRQYVFESGASYVKTLTQYDAMGRAFQVSNPQKNTDATSPLWTTTAFDGLGRVLTVTAPDNSVVTSTYNGNQTTVTDQAGKKRRSIVDGLGRLTQVDELHETSSLYSSTFYTYDSLDNLVKVQQGATNAQTRFFSYDSLKRLTHSRNPELDINTDIIHSDPVTQHSQWDTKYEYDLASNLTRKTDARKITADYFYDDLNRVTDKLYSGTTPDVSYTYDNLTNALGRLTKVQTTVSTTEYSQFDALGRVLQSKQTTAGAPSAYIMSYEYFLDGSLKKQTYPSERVVESSYDQAGRLSQLIGANSTKDETTRTYASQLSYTAHGAVAALRLGNLKWEHTQFNSRLQPTQIGLGTSSGDSSILKLDYTYGVRDANGTLDQTKNNGNVESQQITVSPSLNVMQRYTYDQCNRLLTAEEKLTDLPQTPQWKQTFTYDRYGNRNFDLANTTPNVQSSPLLTFANSSNRISMAGYGYDDAGNLDEEPGGKTYTYDAENRQVTFTVNLQTTNYWYDGDGRRVKKQTPGAQGTTVIYVYDALGRLIAEYDQTAPASSQAYQTSYLTQDHLGSTRVVTKADGSVRARYDYLPFGEEIQASIGGRGTAGYVADNTRQKFTGYEKDSESEIDYAQARYYSSAVSRFTSPDPFGGSGYVIAPQSWNKYVYCLNRPFVFTDPTGLTWVTKDNQNYLWIEDKEYEKNREELEKQGYLNADGAVIQLTSVSGQFSQYSDLVGRYVQLGGDGRLTAVADPTVQIWASYSEEELSGNVPTLLGMANFDTLKGPKNGSRVFPTRGGGRRTRHYKGNGDPYIDIDKHPGHEDLGEFHVHWWENGRRGAPEPVPEGWDIHEWDHGAAEMVQSPIILGPGRSIVPFRPAGQIRFGIRTPFRLPFLKPVFP